MVRLRGIGPDPAYFDVITDVTVNVTDDDTPALIVAPPTVPVDEDGSEVFTVRLATQPSQAVSVMAVSGDVGAVSVPAARLDFNPVNWASAQTVTVRGVDDDDAINETATITVTASGGEYAGVADTVSVNVTDDDTPALIVDPTTVPVTEGGQGSFTVKLATRPTTAAVFQVASGDPGKVSVPSTVTFTTDNWSTAQTITVEGVEDGDADNDLVLVRLRGAGPDPTYFTVTAFVSVNVTDDDTLGIVASPVSVPVTEGGQGVFEVRLATRPSNSVEVAVASDDEDAVSVSADSLDFTTSNWAIAQTVTVTGVQDADTVGETVAVELEATGGNYEGLTASVDVEVSDDDTAQLVVDPATLPVTENGTGAFGVRLSAQPTVTVTVSLSSDDAAAVSVPSTVLTFTTSNWATAQTVTVSGVDDDDDDNESAAVNLGASGGEYEDVTGAVAVTVSDDDLPALVVDPPSVPVTEGASATFTVKLATRPTAAVAITAASGDPDAVSVQMPSVTFTTDNWSTAQSVAVSGVDDDNHTDEQAQVTLSVIGWDADYEPLTADVEVNVEDDDNFAPGVPSDLEVVREDLTQAFVSWSEPANDGTPVTEYTVRWRQRPSGTTWTETTTTILGAQLTGLSAGSEYEVQVRATNSVGDGSWSPSAVFYADDCAAASADSCSLPVGSSAQGRINVHDSVADRDWYQVSLTAGTAYRVDVKGDDSGGTLGDPEVFVHDSSGTAVSGASDNDGGLGNNALLVFIPASTGRLLPRSRRARRRRHRYLHRLCRRQATPQVHQHHKSSATGELSPECASYRSRR